MMGQPLYLGLDLSTQKLKAVVVNSELDVIEEVNVDFDKDTPEYGTKNGANFDPANPQRITAPVAMWLKAVDLCLQKLKSSTRFDISRILGISGCAQQHGTVYWRNEGLEAVENLHVDESLHYELEDGFALKNSPIWMDNSTSAECRQFEEAVGGPEKLSQITGSKAYHRFSGPQILKIFHDSPEVYHNTERISLISSFLCSLFVGSVVGIEVSDASGMNLMDLRTRNWSDGLIDIMDDSLAQKLGQIEESNRSWAISQYCVQKYGFSPACKLTAFTGDNPSALVGMGIKPGDMGISLGTSDTVFLTLNDYRTCLEGHIFVNPTDPGTFMGMLCFKNGSLVRDRIRGSRSWREISDIVSDSPAGNNGNIGFYYDQHEILPDHPADVLRFGPDGQKVEFFDYKTEIRAVLEHQCLAMRLYAEKLGFECHSRRMILTGGASSNPNLQQMLADVFGRDVYVCRSTEAAALGGAIRAMPEDKEQDISLRLAARPNAHNVQIYDQMLKNYGALQEKIMLSVMNSNEK